MDYLDPEKKRSHTRRLFVGYALVAVAIGLGTILMVLLAYGYTFDRTSRSVIQNGLLFVRMGPVNAEVYINGELRGTGNQRLVLPADDYTIEIRADGYRSWEKTIQLAGGSVERFQYPLLFPEELSSSTYRTFSSEPNLLTTSPDRRWLLLQESEDIGAFIRYDLRQQINLPTFFSIPTGVVSTNVEDSTWELIEWSNDNEHLLLRHAFDGGSEHILFNHQDPATSQNLTSRFSDIPFTDVSLVDKQFDAYHLFNRQTGELILAELDEEDTELLLQDVLTYRSHGSDRVLYISSAQLPTGTATDEDDPVFEARILEDNEVYTLTTLPIGERQDYLLDLARFDGDWYVVAGMSAEKRALVYKNPVEQISRSSSSRVLPVATLRTDDAPKRISFSANARNIKLQSNNQLAVYDLAREQSYQYTFGDDATERAYWMDGHRLVTSWDNTLSVVDFDGENQQELVACKDNLQPHFDTDYEYMYCIASSEDSFGALKRYSLLATD